jgi:adenylyltransferase/sulfurtransferase
MSLSQEEITYYDRQLVLNGFGTAAQLKLKNASVAIVGVGGLGCPAALYLAASGVGRIALIDFDTVDVSNLQRQVLYNMQDVGKSKAMLAKLKLEVRNPHISITAIESKLTAENAFDLLMAYDYVLDCSDNFGTRYLINDLCVKTDKTFISGSIFQYQGQVGVFNAPLSDTSRSATYRCLFPSPPHAMDAPSCDQIGVLGAVPGFVGTLMAVETVKVITGIGQALIDKYLVFDQYSMQQNTFSYHRDEAEAKKIKNTPLEDDMYYSNLCSIQSADQGGSFEVDASELRKLIRNQEPLVLVDVRDIREHELLNIGGLSIPLNELRSRYFEIPRDKKVILYCKMGQRSSEALKYLQLNKGYSNVYQLTGGIRAYLNSK